MKTLLRFLLLWTLLSVAFVARASDFDDGYTGSAQWDSFRDYMSTRQHEDQVLGASYIISGAVATIGGVVGYYNSQDSFTRGVYAVAQSVGVAAIGYGASQYWIGNEYNSFFYAVDGAPLSSSQKADLLQRYLERDREVRQRTRWIKVVTHSLVATVNLYNSTRESDPNVRSILQFLAGTNAVIAFSYAF
jgi:hypothetical protein